MTTTRDPEAERRGFTLLEVLIAVALCATAMVVFSTTTAVNLSISEKLQMRTQAALLIRGAVLDLEAQIRKDGVSSNSVEGRECELPEQFRDTFKCEYDLMKFEIPDDTLNELLNEVSAKLTGALGGFQGAPGGQSNVTDFSKILGDPQSLDKSSLGKILLGDAENKGGLDLSKLTPFLPLILDTSGEFQRFCNFNLQTALINFTLVIAMFPVLAKEISERTRQLKVRITWQNDTNTVHVVRDRSRMVEVTTYVTFVDKELKLLDAQDTSTTPTTPTAPTRP